MVTFMMETLGLELATCILHNSTTGTFTFNQKIDKPVKIEIYSVVNDPTINSFKMLLKSLEIISMKNQLKQQSAMMNLRNISDF